MNENEIQIEFCNYYNHRIQPPYFPCKSCPKAHWNDKFWSPIECDYRSRELFYEEDVKSRE